MIIIGYCLSSIYDHTVTVLHVFHGKKGNSIKIVKTQQNKVLLFRESPKAKEINNQYGAHLCCVVYCFKCLPSIVTFYSVFNTHPTWVLIGYVLEDIISS